MSQQRATGATGDAQAFADRLCEFRTTLPAKHQLLLDTVILAACSAQADVRGYALVDEVFENLRSYWLDPAHFDPQTELGPGTDEDRAVLARLRDARNSHLARLAHRQAE
jgi:hypothetical protein